MCGAHEEAAGAAATGSSPSPTCKIQWVGKDGQPTPDNATAIGYAYRVAYSEILYGREMRFEESERFPICAFHARRLTEPGMHHWRLIPLEQASCA